MLKSKPDKTDLLTQQIYVVQWCTYNIGRDRRDDSTLISEKEIIDANHTHQQMFPNPGYNSHVSGSAKERNLTLNVLN